MTANGSSHFGATDRRAIRRGGAAPAASRRHPDAASVPASQPLHTLPDAVRAAVAHHNAVFSVVDLGAPEAARQLGALLSVWPLLTRPGVVALIRGRLPYLEPLPTRLALQLLVSAQGEADADIPKLCPHDLATVVSRLWELSCEEPGGGHGELGEHPIDAWSAGTTFLWDLLLRTVATAADALAAAEHTTDPEAYGMCVFLASCLQPASATIAWFEQASRADRLLAQNREVQQTMQAVYEDPDGPGLDFPRHF